jgi:1-acyl-sn-glycerol-3-phosphate acyltransferase
MPSRLIPPQQSSIEMARRWLVGLLGWSVLVPGVLVANFMQMLSVVLLPFSRRAFRRVNSAIAGGWWGACVIYASRLQGTQIHVTGDEIPQDENAILVVNHQSMSDIPVLLDYGYRHGRLGDLKWYVKDVIKWVPGIGWGMLFLDCLFIKRNWAADKAGIEKVFRGLRAGKVPAWIVSFAEGTRFTPAKQVRSVEYARKHGRPELHHVLLPRTKGVIATLDGMGKHAHAVYNITIGYHGPVPTLGQYFLGRATDVSLNISRTSLADLPATNEERTDWLFEQYKLKDSLLEQHRSNGQMPGHPRNCERK